MLEDIALAMYPTLASLGNNSDPGAILAYTNTLTGGILGILIIASFYLIILLGTFFAQYRFGRATDPAVCFAAAGFSTFGLSIIMSLQPGLLNPVYVWICMAAAILGMIGLWVSRQNT